MRIRQKKIKRMDDRNLIGFSHAVQGRCVDSIASAMKNLLKEKPEFAMEHMVDALDYLMEYKNSNHEVWKRYRKKCREARRKSVVVKGLLKTGLGDAPIPEGFFEVSE